mgnify:CR=1 FL=1
MLTQVIEGFMTRTSRSFFSAAACLAVLTISVAGCGPEGDPITMDTIMIEDLAESDSIEDFDTTPDLIDDRDLIVDPDTAVPDVAENDLVVATDDGVVDVVDDVVADVAVTDVVVPDTQEEDTSEPAPFCDGYDDCADNESCLLSLGMCQTRATWTSAALGLFNVHSMDGAASDRLIIDGERFTTGGLLAGDVKVKVGTVLVSGTSIAKDENRLYIAVSGTMQGQITVYDSDNKVATIPGPFKQSPKGKVACDGSTPAASGEIPENPWEAGPYAAGYVDIKADWGTSKTRVYYPAECGSIRRPAVVGTWPLVVILHGNGALHLQYEYLAELFATWGFVSIMPLTISNLVNEDYSQLIFDTAPVIERFRGKELSAEHEVLAGVTTTSNIFFVGHSRGTGRAEELANVNESGLWDYTLGGIYLGPVDDYGWSVPGYLMVFGGGKDRQSNAMTYEAGYNEHTGDKWLIEIPGANHGSFCDHKVYGYGALGPMGDAEPLISRHRQHMIVQMFAVPLIQRAFGLDEPFTDYLDLPPAGTDYTVEHAPAQD